MATDTTTDDIYDVAAEFDRLFPDQVDTEHRDWGQGQEAGHIGHDHSSRGDESDTVGWFCDAGNVGHPVMDIRRDDVARAAEALRLVNAPATLREVEAAFTVAGVAFERRF